MDEKAWLQVLPETLKIPGWVFVCESTWNCLFRPMTMPCSQLCLVHTIFSFVSESLLSFGFPSLLGYV